MAFEQFQNYPNYNVTISGVTFPTNLNTTYYWDGWKEGEKFEYHTVEQSLDYGYIYWSGDYWLLYATDGSDYFRAPLSASDNPWEITEWEPVDGGSGPGQGTPILTPIPFNKSNIIVSGIEPYNGIDLNGEYLLGLLGTGYSSVENYGLYAERPVYLKPNGSENPDDWDWVYWDGVTWEIYCRESETDNNEFFSNSSTYYPFDATDWTSTGTFSGTPSVRGSQNTHGLSPETVALITQNFGSVENFLRLRNQGQI